MRRLVLETGIRQVAAIALYRGSGFEPIPLYGEYGLSPDTSLCFGKALVWAGAPVSQSAVPGARSFQTPNRSSAFASHLGDRDF